jgi:hypothetical protein
MRGLGMCPDNIIFVAILSRAKLPTAVSQHLIQAPKHATTAGSCIAKVGAWQMLT